MEVLDHSLHITTNLPGLYVALNLMIALAYIAIPVALVLLNRRVKDHTVKALIWTFGAFITACAAHHAMIAAAVLYDVDGYMGAVDFCTAIISVAAAVLVWAVILSRRVKVTRGTSATA